MTSEGEVVVTVDEKQNNTQELFDIEDSVVTDIEQEVPTE